MSKVSKTLLVLLTGLLIILVWAKCEIDAYKLKIEELSNQKELLHNNALALQGTIKVLKNKEGEYYSSTNALILSNKELKKMNISLTRKVLNYEQTLNQAASVTISSEDSLPSVVAHIDTVGTVIILQDSVISMKLLARMTDSLRFTNIAYRINIPLFVAFESSPTEAKVLFSSLKNVTFKNIEAFTVPYPKVKYSRLGLGISAGLGLGMSKTQEFNSTGVLVERYKPVITPTISIGLNFNIFRL